MEKVFSPSCLGCSGRVLEDARGPRIEEIEARADRIGVLVHQGVVRCVDGPERTLEEGKPVERCGRVFIRPVIRDADLDEEVVRVCQEPPRQPDQYDSLQF